TPHLRRGRSRNWWTRTSVCGQRSSPLKPERVTPERNTTHIMGRYIVIYLMIKCVVDRDFDLHLKQTDGESGKEATHAKDNGRSGGEHMHTSASNENLNSEDEKESCNEAREEDIDMHPDTLDDDADDVTYLPRQYLPFLFIF